MNSPRTPALLHPDFKVPLKGLASSVQNAMVSWYSVRTASLRSSSQTTILRNPLAPLTKSLQIHWANMNPYLQKSNDFSEDVVTWSNSLEGGPDPGSTSLLEELASCSDELCRQTEALVSQSDEDIKCLFSLESKLSDLLRGSSKYTHNGVFPETTAFLGLTSSSPDGFLATSAALSEIRAHLYMLSQCWTIVSDACRSLLKLDGNIPQDHTRKLGDIWKEYQAEILDAKVSIARSLDAVGVEPAIRPDPRRQQRRRGSSKSEASSSSSALLSPRRMHSLDDEVPQSCWGGFGRKKR
ncbi:hypothetical protein B0H19DRAFT_1370568 [Mycena capillaripes]|nr:hypothetical protein B0H19DRAFT_1370568 [Mycena capillaripes]